ncbi:MAG: hypothetical protein U0610_04410 [bacterium]
MSVLGEIAGRRCRLLELLGIYGSIHGARDGHRQGLAGNSVAAAGSRRRRGSSRRPRALPRELGFPAIRETRDRAARRAAGAEELVENEAQARARRPRDDRALPATGAGGGCRAGSSPWGCSASAIHARCRRWRSCSWTSASGRSTPSSTSRTGARRSLRPPARVDPALLRELTKAALTAFHALGCRDVARVDLRLDTAGRVNFVELNPLPGLSPGWSDLCLIAASAGIEYRDLIGRILAPAIGASMQGAGSLEVTAIDARDVTERGRLLHVAFLVDVASSRRTADRESRSQQNACVD